MPVRKTVNLSQASSAKAETLKSEISKVVGVKLSYSNLFEILHTRLDDVVNCLRAFK